MTRPKSNNVASSPLPGLEKWATKVPVSLAEQRQVQLVVCDRVPRQYVALTLDALGLLRRIPREA
jgi:hypothetical protein